MAVLLHIDTSIETASIALSSDKQILHVERNKNIRDHASWIHVAIQSLLSQCDKKVTDLSAVAVVEGPGSYTGLRVGMATAKGLCFSLGIPMITESSLRLMAFAAISNHEAGSEPNVVFIPMIDARRMEVFTAGYDLHLNEVLSPSAVVLESTSFDHLAKNNRLVFFGNGSKKFQDIVSHDEFRFIHAQHDAGDLVPLAFQKFRGGDFADLAYSEPAYLKEFYTHPKK